MNQGCFDPGWRMSKGTLLVIRTINEMSNKGWRLHTPRWRSKLWGARRQLFSHREDCRQTWGQQCLQTFSFPSGDAYTLWGKLLGWRLRATNCGGWRRVPLWWLNRIIDYPMIVLDFMTTTQHGFLKPLGHSEALTRIIPWIMTTRPLLFVLSPWSLTKLTGFAVVLAVFPLWCCCGNVHPAATSIYHYHISIASRSLVG